MTALDQATPAGWFSAEWPAFLDPKLVKPSDVRSASGALAVGLLVDTSIRAGVVGTAGAVTIATATLAVLVSDRLRNPQAFAFIAAAPLFGVWLAVRTSPSLMPLDLLAAAALLALGSSLARGGSIWDVSMPNAMARTVQAATQAILAAPFLLARKAREDRVPSRSHFGGIVRGLLIALPLAAILGALFASGDVVFAQLFRFNAADWLLHFLFASLGAIGMGALLRLASIEQTRVPHVEGPHLAETEWTVVLGVLDLLFLAFAAAQIVGLSQGGRHVIRTAGLTYAQYARSGFFQLLAASIITLGALLALRATADLSTHRRRFAVLAIGLTVLTLAVDMSAFSRLVLYERAFGLTTLRLYAHTAIVWVAAVLILMAIFVAQHVTSGRPRSWVPAAAGVVALTLLLALNIFNPDAFIAQHNLEAHGQRIDHAYVGALSDDAVPSLVQRAAQAEPALRTPLFVQICKTSAHRFTGWAAYNIARDRAAKARATVCPGQGG